MGACRLTPTPSLSPSFALIGCASIVFHFVGGWLLTASQPAAESASRPNSTTFVVGVSSILASLLDTCTILTPIMNAVSMSRSFKVNYAATVFLFFCTRNLVSLFPSPAIHEILFKEEKNWFSTFWRLRKLVD